MASRREGDTQKYSLVWEPQKTNLAKILLTMETMVTNTMGRKVTAVVSLGARRRGWREEGMKFFSC
jgi:hypothetical protein